MIDDGVTEIHSKKLFKLMEMKDEGEVMKIINVAHEDVLRSVDEYQSTVLHVACVNGLFNVAKRILELKHQDINAIDDNCQTPLHWAVINGHLNIVTLLRSFISQFPNFNSFIN